MERMKGRGELNEKRWKRSRLKKKLNMHERSENKDKKWFNS